MPDESSRDHDVSPQMKETNTAAAAAGANTALTAVVISALNAINLPFPTDNPGAICRR